MGVGSGSGLGGSLNDDEFTCPQLRSFEWLYHLPEAQVGDFLGELTAATSAAPGERLGSVKSVLQTWLGIVQAQSHSASGEA